jgi:2-polyprenyl-3-methyl-5-hydroxy-6-metoxy-1,4-benzoquinol methylase
MNPIAINKAYTGPRSDLLEILPITCRYILDVGCSTGTFGFQIKQRQDAQVVGVELNASAAALARARLNEVISSNVESSAFRDRIRGRQFDAVVFGDVLEHLVDPWSLVEFVVAEATAESAVIIVSVPNVAHWSTLYNVWLRGTWPRQPRGVHDATHLRWFTQADAEHLLRGAGLRIKRVRKKLRLIEQPHKWNNSRVERWLHSILGSLMVHQIVLQGVKQ